VYGAVIKFGDFGPYVSVYVNGQVTTWEFALRDNEAKSPMRMRYSCQKAINYVKEKIENSKPCIFDERLGLPWIDPIGKSKK
jgi:hypothetical protein